MARYALVVGIPQYCSPLKNLDKTTTDAEAVARLLESHGDFTEVIRFPSRRNRETQKREMSVKPVTGNELGQAIQTLLIQAERSDALIYFTGHGITVSGNLGQQRGYLATSDCEIEAQGDQIINQKHGIPLDELNALIGKSELSSLIVLFDCCHSGYFLERNLIEQTFNSFSAQRDYYLITACRSFQTAKALKSEKNSVFTGALLRGLAAENADSERRISGDRLFDFISRELRGSTQEPIRLGWGRSLVLVTHPPLAAPPQLNVDSKPDFNRENPYLGLRAFESAEGDYFFGRVLAVRALLDCLKDGRFLGVIGRSGCGKSSLVKAGLLPELKRDRLPGSSEWPVAVFTPGAHPLEALQKVLEQQPNNQPFLLFIDQFEEVFTLCESEAERKEFISRMTEEATSAERFTRVIVAMRGDFLDRCALYHETADLINRTRTTTYFVTPLTFEELHAAIEEPAKKHGVSFETGLVSQIIEDVMDQPGGLPLLQYALAELWRVCLTDANYSEFQLTFQGYKAIGGVKGALEKRADDLYQNLAPADKDFMRRLFLNLVQPGEDQEATRRRASWQDLQIEADSEEQLLRVTRQLASQEQRLIITDENTVEVAHEALLTEWKRLGNWIEQERENLRLRRRLKAECEEWERNSQPDGLLLSDTWLVAINDWEKKTSPRLSAVEREFLRDSLEKREREVQDKLGKERELREAAEARAIAELEKAIEADARAKVETEKAKEEKARTKAEVHKNRWLIVAIASLAGIATLAIVLKQEAELGEAAVTKNLISRPQYLLEKSYQIEALVETINALKVLQDKQSKVPPELQKVISGVLERNRLEGHSEEVNDASFSPNGELIASGGNDKTVKVWGKNGKFQTEFKHEDGVWGVSFSPNNRTIAAGDADGIIKIWDIKTGSTIQTLKSQGVDKDKDSVSQVIFSPDGELIASAHTDRTIKLWRVSDNTLLHTFEPHKQKVEGVSFIADGNMIASASTDGTVKLWRVADFKLLHTFEVNEGTVYEASFSPDGKTLASASKNGTIQIWSLDPKYLLIKSFQAHSKAVYGLSFSPDGKWLVSAGKDKLVKLWRSSDYQQVQVFEGHNAEVNRVKFSPNSQIIISASRDSTVRLWDINPIAIASDITNDALKITCGSISNYLEYNSKIPQAERSLCK